MSEEKFDFDLIVIGGGSGGISCAREASKYGAKIALLDFVKPSPKGTKYGLGGTCVNVGCIPKKLFHTSAIVGKIIKHSEYYGWTNSKGEKLKKDLNNNWVNVKNNINQHIKGLNFKYKVALKTSNVKYFNEYGTLLDKHTVEKTDHKGKKSKITGKYIVISVGGRPNQLDVPGGENCITSDDVFQLKKHPGKTLCIGASYVALECAGFLQGLGAEVTIMVRSIVLRGFDRECAEMIKFHLEYGVTRFKDDIDDDETKNKLRKLKILEPCSPSKVEKLENGKLKVTWKMDVDGKVQIGSDVFDTVFVATGRTPETKYLNLEKIGVKLDQNGKIKVNDVEQSTVSSIYAIGDVISGGLELTPVAIKAGKLLAERLFNLKSKGQKMDYINVPTTVFTPLEYGCVGYSEDAAISKFGKENLVIYKKNCNILENEIPDNWLGIVDQSFFKLVCLKNQNEKVIGFHYCGPNAGEITQGVAIAVKLGASKEDFDNTVGIHPTIAENMTRLEFGVTEDTGC